MLVLAVYSYVNTAFAEVYRFYHIPGKPLEIITAFLVITFAIWEVNRLVGRSFSPSAVLSKGIRQLAFFFAGSVVYSSLIAGVVVYIAGTHFYHLEGATLAIVIKLAVTFGTRINLFLHVLNAIIFIFQRFRAKEVEAEELKKVNAQAQLQAIKNQVNPHFLFNNLNVLSTLVLQESPDANKFIEEFCIVYRHVLNSERQELVSLRDELEFIRHYIFLLKQRFPESIVIDIAVPDMYEPYGIVPVATQMLIENAIKHNIVSKAHPLRIEVFVAADERLVVKNNLQPKTALEGSTQIGLTNIDQRYRLIAQKNIDVVRSADHFAVSLPLINPAI
jgi:two-component system LytT family sensor kinase